MHCCSRGTHFHGVVSRITCFLLRSTTTTKRLATLSTYRRYRNKCTLCCKKGNFVEICNVYIGKMIIKAAKRIFNSGKICRSYSDLNFGVTFL